MASFGVLNVSTVSTGPNIWREGREGGGREGGVGRGREGGVGRGREGENWIVRRTMAASR